MTSGPKRNLKKMELLNREHAQRTHDRLNEATARIDASAIAFGQIAVRTLVLVNGGAVVAMLAFLAGVVGSKHTSAFDPVIGSLSFFAFGVFLGVLTAGLAYVVTYCQSASLGRMTHIWKHPYSEETRSSKNWTRVANFSHVLALLSAMGSIVFFYLGIQTLSTAMIDTL